MRQTLDAVYENGCFRLLDTSELNLSQGQHVRLIVEAASEGEDILALAARVYEGLSDEEINEIERIALDRGQFFNGRTTL